MFLTFIECNVPLWKSGEAYGPFLNYVFKFLIAGNSKFHLEASEGEKKDSICPYLSSYPSLKS